VGKGPMRQEAIRLAKLAEEAEALGLRIALENMPDVSPRQTGGRISYGLDPAMVAAQVRSVGLGALTGCLDVSHAAIAADARGSDLAADIRAMSPTIGHIHMHDSFARAPGLFLWTTEEAATFGIGDTHLPPGWGTIDFETLFDGLRVRADTAITLEIMPRHIDREVLTESLNHARRAARGLMATNGSACVGR
jgi:sugar phosphate isomerase/epimerase